MQVHNSTNGWNACTPSNLTQAQDKKPRKRETTWPEILEARDLYENYPFVFYNISIPGYTKKKKKDKKRLVVKFT
jgi:hypothetical protein